VLLFLSCFCTEALEFGNFPYIIKTKYAGDMGRIVMVD
jgi:hypothetical protein